MNDVSEDSFISSGVLRQNGGNQFRNVMYSFKETADNFRRKFVPYYVRQGSCVQDCAIRVVLVYLMCGTQTFTKCISVLVPLRKRTAIPIVVHIVMPSVYHTKFIDSTPVNKS